MTAVLTTLPMRTISWESDYYIDERLYMFDGRYFLQETSSEEEPLKESPLKEIHPELAALWLMRNGYQLPTDLHYLAKDAE